MSTSHSPARQLSLPVRLDDSATFDNFFATSDNSLALKACRDSARGAGWVFLFGPSGAGRSHLLQAACHECKGTARYFPLAELADCDPGAVLENVESASLVALDDIDAVITDPAWAEQLFHALNRMQRSGSGGLISARQAPRQLPCILPDLQSRLSWHPAIRIAALDDAQRIAALCARAHHRGLELDETVARYIIHRYSREPARLFALLETLDQRSLELQRRLTIAFVREVMASDIQQ